MITSVDLMEFELEARMLVEQIAKEFVERYNAPQIEAEATRQALMAGPMRATDQQAANRARRVAKMYGGGDVRVR